MRRKIQRTHRPAASSALDAAAHVLAGDAGPLNCNEMLDAMAAKVYWAVARRQDVCLDALHGGDNVAEMCPRWRH